MHNLLLRVIITPWPIHLEKSQFVSKADQIQILRHLSHLAPSDSDVIDSFCFKAPLPRCEAALGVEHEQLRRKGSFQKTIQDGKKPQPKSSKINHCISINSKQGYLAIMYLDALSIIT